MPAARWPTWRPPKTFSSPVKPWAPLGFDTFPVPTWNPPAELRPFGGARGGAVCTSSNAKAIFEGPSQREPKIFFFPDEHLGRNPGWALGIPLASMVVWDPAKESGGLTREDLERARVILWKGCCSVHTKFQLRHVEERRREDPGLRILGHPEVPYDV